MKKLLKILGILVGVLAMAIACTAAWVSFTDLPTHPVKNLNVQLPTDSISIAHGAKIARTVCGGCHVGESGKWDGRLFIPKSEGMGDIYSGNITQHPTAGLGRYGDGEEDLVSVSAKNYQIVWINSFTLPKDFSAELVAFYQSKSLSGTYISLPLRFVNIGFQKKLKGDHGTLRFGIDDLFNSMFFRWDSNFPEYNLVSTGTLDFSNRTFKLTYSRSFGNNKLNGARQRGTSSEEERKRVN